MTSLTVGKWSCPRTTSCRPQTRPLSRSWVLNPLSPGLVVLDALPLLALALLSLGILLLGVRLAGVLAAHFATLHLFYGGHYASVWGALRGCSSNLPVFDFGNSRCSPSIWAQGGGGNQRGAAREIVR
jgi:hypothetical protein